VQIAADGSFSTPASLDSVLSTDGETYWFLNTGALSGNRLLIPVSKFTTGTNGVLVGGPKTNPTFNYVPIGTSAGPEDMKISHQVGKEVLAWVDFNPLTNDESLIYMATSTNGGATWTTPTLALNLDTTPPPNVSVQDTVNIYTLSLGQNLNGSVGMLYTSWAAYYAPPQ
jgi:hypothetical protein